MILLSGILLHTFSEPLSEKDIIMKALSQNSDLKIEQLRIRKGDLDLKDAHARKRPNLNFTLSGTTTDSASSASGSVTARQHIPGGGQISGSAQQGRSGNFSGSDIYDRAITARIEQPLLRGAWGADPVEHSVKVSSVNQTLLSLQSKQTILSRLSEARQHFWNLYERKMFLAISRKRSEQANDILTSQRARYRIGEASVLDTLSAALESAAAEQNLLRSQFEHESARSTLATFLNEDADSISISDSVSLNFPDLPEPREFMDLARKYDPQLEIFSRMRDLLNMHLKQAKNELLPTVNVQASYSRSALDSRFFSSFTPQANKSIGLILSYDLPQTSNRSEIERRRLDLEIQGENEKQHKINLEHQLGELKRRWEQDKLQVEYAQASSELAQKQFDATMKGYELGTENRLSMEKAQNDLTAAQTSYAQSLVQLKKLQIIIDEITGATFNRFGVELK